MLKSFTPGKVWTDEQGFRIQAHGGCIFYENGTYYWYGENKEKTLPGTRIWHYGVKMYSSKDLYNWKDEGMLMLAGLTGGTLYFIAENNALNISQASNVALLVCTTPIFTALLANWAFKEPLRKNMMIGSFIALIGVGLVVFSGSVILKINPLGDFLSIMAALMWAVYCLILKPLGNRYSTAFITRKVFLYSILSLLVYFLFVPLQMDTEILFHPVVVFNLLFLGIVASMLCFIAWNAAVKVLGPSRTANYIYVQPFSTLVLSSIILSEVITLTSMIGALCIIGGVYLAEKE